MSLKIDHRRMPDDGLHLEGRLPASFFALTKEDKLRAISPMEYELDVVRDEDGLLITGHVAATFEMECGRCMQRFQHRVDMSDYVAELAIENDVPLDLTDTLREDILLTLPTYPRCEDGNVQPRECPAEGSFEAAPESVGTEPHEETDKAVWDALDQLKNLKQN